MGWYKEWFGTRYYALLYGHRDEVEAARWVRAVVTRWRPRSGDRLLDLACGRGRHARYFAEAGLTVTGVDLSPESIAEATRNVPGARFVVHDMRTPFEPGQFDLVCCLFTSLGYTRDRRDDRAIFEAVASDLRPGGRFVLDFMNTAAVLRDLVADEVVTREDVEFHITRTVEEGVIVKRIEVRDGPERHLYEERVLALMPEELQQMAVDAGLEVEECTDGPDISPFDPETSQRFVMWTKRPETP